MSSLTGKDREQYVRSLFSAIAGQYDRMNQIMTLGLLPRWQARAVATLRLQPGASALDVCCGTGELALAMARLVQPGGRVVGLDFTPAMLELARRKAQVLRDAGLTGVAASLHFVEGDALNLPFADNEFDGAICGFAFRNVTDLPRAIREMARVVRPGGRVVSLEMSHPESPLLALGHRLYLYGAVPVLGYLLASRRRIGGQERPYTYLPHSLTRFPGRRALEDLFRAQGLTDVGSVPLLGGAAAIHWGVKPGGHGGPLSDEGPQNPIRQDGKNSQACQGIETLAFPRQLEGGP
ncbi:MAG: ubiquinone/menaquinone biosynthesis methyltransferase [Firmicutes bacterium]|nr:ubiquinone/menaquinone biosynthesis methyltransferase [Bacillota bacterium]